MHREPTSRSRAAPTKLVNTIIVNTKGEGHDIVNIGLHFFLKDVRPMLPPVMNRSIVDA